MSDYILILPEIFLALASMMLLIYGAARGEASYRAVSGAGLCALLLTIGLVVNGRADGIGFHGMFLVDGFARLSKLLLLGSASLALLLSTTYLEKMRINKPEYPVLLMMGTLGAMLMVSANDFLMVYVGLEMQSMALYVLAAFRSHHPSASDAGLKYFVLSALASGFLLFGISLVYGLVGSTQFDAVAMNLNNKAHGFATMAALGFMLCGLAFKISAVPFHMWTPDVYDSAPTSVTAFFASTPKLAAIIMLTRLLTQPLAALDHGAVQALFFVAAASMLLGSFAGLVQTRIKRLMAYSAIANMGTALVALASPGTQGVAALLVYIAIYSVNTLGAFAVIVCLARGGVMVDKVSDVAGLSKSHPWLALLMSFFMFSLAGVPPLAGFFGKYFVFLAAIDAGLWPLAALGVLCSVVAAGYYLKIVKTMYFDEPLLAAIDPVPAWSLRIATALAGGAVASFVLMPSVLMDAAHAAAQSLIGS